MGKEKHLEIPDSEKKLGVDEIGKERSSLARVVGTSCPETQWGDGLVGDDNLRVQAGGQTCDGRR